MSTSSNCGRSSAAHSEEGLLAYKQSSLGVSRMSKTTRFVDSPVQQDGPLHVALAGATSGIPTGATAQWWMANRLVPALSSSNVLLLAVAAIIIGLQVMIVVVSTMIVMMPTFSATMVITTTNQKWLHDF